MKKIRQGLIGQALSKYIIGAAMVGLMLFLPAGTFHYWNAWVLMTALFIPMLAAGLVMLAYSPDLLRKRLNSKEKEGEQKTVVALSGLMFVAAFIIAGLTSDTAGHQSLPGPYGPRPESSYCLI